MPATRRSIYHIYLIPQGSFHVSISQIRGSRAKKVPHQGYLVVEESGYEYKMTSTETVCQWQSKPKVAALLKQGRKEDKLNCMESRVAYLIRAWWKEWSSHILIHYIWRRPFSKYDLTHNFSYQNTFQSRCTSQATSKLINMGHQWHLQSVMEREMLRRRMKSIWS